MQIKDLAIGDGYVYLMEGGSKVKFYVLAHNYESGRNGKGRTLFCRERPAMSGPWSSVGDAGRRNNIAWGITDPGSSGETHTCTIYNWLTTTYFYKFAADVKGWMGKTKYLANRTTFSTSIFTLSESESVYDLSSRPEGTLLSEAARKRLENIFTDFGANIWTRTQSSVLSYHHDSSDNDYYYDGVALSGVSRNDWGRFSTTYGHTPNWGYLPCFTLPETLYVTDDGFATENQTPKLTSTAGAALGQKNAAFAWKYTVTDADGDTLTVTEKLDGKTTKTRTSVASGTALTFEQAADAAGFQRILNGNHTLTVEASDGKGSTSLNATFVKSVTSASVTLTTPLAVDGDITVAVLQVAGSIPDDAVFRAEVTNNANDLSPVWQDATTEVQKGVNIVFENKTATAGSAFNFRVSVSRGASGTGGYIEAVSGAFQ